MVSLCSKSSSERYFWYARYHHIVMDAFGMCLVARRVAEVYTELADGRAASDGLFGPFAALLEEDAAYRASAQFARDQQYWSDSSPAGLSRSTLGGRASDKSQGFLRHSGFLSAATRRPAGLNRPQDWEHSIPNHNGGRRDPPASLDRRRGPHIRPGRRCAHARIEAHSRNGLQCAAAARGIASEHDGVRSDQPDGAPDARNFGARALSRRGPARPY